jgi:hypothetical protein
MAAGRLAVTAAEKTPATADVTPKADLVQAKARAGSIRSQLTKPITLDKGIDVNTPLKEALEFIADRAGVVTIIDTEAFKRQGIPEIGNQPVSLPPLKGMRLSTVLRLLLGQTQATYLLRPEYIEITTGERAQLEVWGAVQEKAEDAPTAGRKRPLMELTQAVFEQTPLQEAVQELSASTGVSVVLDIRRAGEKAKTAVSASFTNVPLDTAVRILANQVELSAVHLDNVLFVTTPENARKMQAEQKKVNQKGLEERPQSSGPPAA